MGGKGRLKGGWCAWGEWGTWGSGEPDTSRVVEGRRAVKVGNKGYKGFEWYKGCAWSLSLRGMWRGEGKPLKGRGCWEVYLEGICGGGKSWCRGVCGWMVATMAVVGYNRLYWGLANPIKPRWWSYNHHTKPQNSSSSSVFSQKRHKKIDWSIDMV